MAPVRNSHGDTSVKKLNASKARVARMPTVVSTDTEAARKNRRCAMRPSSSPRLRRLARPVTPVLVMPVEEMLLPYAW